MVILRIQHPISDYERWKAAFDSDPADRRGSGVVRYRIHRPVADPHFVMIDLEFRTAEEAQGLLHTMQRIWDSGKSPASAAPEAWIVDTVENVELG